jgi:hypothetical protein
MQSTSVRSKFVRLLRNRDAMDNSPEDDEDDEEEEEEAYKGGQFLSSAETTSRTIWLPSYCSRSTFTFSSSLSLSLKDKSIMAAFDDEEFEGPDEDGGGGGGSSPCSRQEVDSSSDTSSGCSNFTLKSSNFCRFRI